MGSSSSSVDHVVPDVLQLSRETGFSAAHLLRLHERFEVLDRGQTGELRPQDFAALQGLALNPIGDRIIGAFFSAGVSEQETGNVSSSVLSPQTGSGGLSLLRPGPGSLPARRLEPRRDAGGAGQQPDREAPIRLPDVRSGRRREDLQRRAAAGAAGDAGDAGDGGAAAEHRRASDPGDRPRRRRRHRLRRVQEVCGENEHRSHDEYSLPEVTTGPGEEEFMNMFYVSTTIKESFTRCCRARVEPPGGTITESISRQDRERSPSRLNSDANGKQFLQLSSAVVMETPLFVLLCGRSVPPDEGR